MKIWRMVRGVAGTALAWAVVWSAVAVLFRIGRHLVRPVHGSWHALIESLLPGVQYGFVYGAAMGAGFALLVICLSRRARTLESLSLPIFGMCGALVAVSAHMLVAGIDVSAFGLLLLSGLLGSGTASSTLLMARRSLRLSPAASRQELPN